MPGEDKLLRDKVSETRAPTGKGLGAGKLPPSLLKSHVLVYTGKRRPEVLSGAALGEDSAIIDLGGDLCVVSSDPITAATRDAGALAVHVSCNDVAANGAEPVAFLLTVLVPVGTDAAWISGLMSQVHQTACELGVQVVGGHTEITPGLRDPVLCGTVIGRAPRGRARRSGGASPGDSLLVTRAAGIEGTAVLASDYPDYCSSVLGEQGFRRALAMCAEISVVHHALAASEAGATAMHDVTEGGILGAAYEMAEAAGCGVSIDIARIPVRRETGLLCSDLGIDPLRLISSGCLLIATPDPSKIVAAVRDVECTVIGCFVAGSSTAKGPDGERLLDPPAGDELWAAKEALGKRGYATAGPP